VALREQRPTHLEFSPVITELAGILLPVLLLASVGAGWRWLGFPFEREFVTRMIMNVAGPCLIVDSLSRQTLPLAEFLWMLAASVTLLAGTAVVALALLKSVRLPARSFLPPLMFGNSGNIGLPLCLFAFGPEGLALGVAVYVTGSVAQFTIAPVFQSRAPALRTLASTPVAYGAAIGISLLALDIALPDWLATTVGLLGDLMIPLMLLALGNTLGGLRVARLPLAATLGAARIMIGLAVALGVGWLFGLEGIALGVLVLQGAMPAAVFNYLLAARYDRDADDVAGIVLMSTLIGALLLPLIVSFALWLAG
jgi:malate permease and related proteins